MTLRVIKKVIIKDQDYNRPGPGHLNPGSVVKITSPPTSISDLQFTVLDGTGECLRRRLRSEDTIRTISGPGGCYFFWEGHETKAPYDWGTLDPEFFEIVDNIMNPERDD